MDWTANAQSCVCACVYVCMSSLPFSLLQLSMVIHFKVQSKSEEISGTFFFESFRGYLQVVWHIRTRIVAIRSPHSHLFVDMFKSQMAHERQHLMYFGVECRCERTLIWKQCLICISRWFILPYSSFGFLLCRFISGCCIFSYIICSCTFCCISMQQECATREKDEQEEGINNNV